jgi:hypothetical protein
MSTTALSNTDIEEIERRMRERRMMGELPAPVMPPQPGTFAHAKMLDDERKLAERRAAARAREEEEAREREAEAERQREEWEKNAPARAKAQEELKRVERELNAVNAECEKLLARGRELEGVVNR